MADLETSNNKPARRIAKKFLAPIAATAASAAATYVAKKAPAFIEDTVLPRLRDAAGSAGNTADGVPARAKSAVGSFGDVAEQLTERAKGVAGAGGRPQRNSRNRTRLSAEELERRHAQRAEARQRRREASNN